MKKIDLPIKENKEDKINPSNPDFRWLGKMLIIIIPFLIISYLCFYLFSYFIIGSISLEKEKKLFSNISFIKEDKTLFNINDYLKNKIIDLKNINIYLENSEDINAYAFIGGNIILTKGLLENIDYEEELIFIIGHEMKHIENRDVLHSLLTEIPFYLTLHFFGFNFDKDMVNITNKYRSRITELNADIGGIELINKMNLNLNCSINFFENGNGDFNNYLLLLSDHPTNIKRIEIIKQMNLNKNKKCHKFIYYKKD